MKKRIDHKVDPFSTIRLLPERPLFKDCPVKPPKETIESAEELYLKFSFDPPSYVSTKDDWIIFEWQYYRKDKFLRDHLVYAKELTIKDATNMEWNTYDYADYTN